MINFDEFDIEEIKNGGSITEYIDAFFYSSVPLKESMIIIKTCGDFTELFNTLKRYDVSWAGGAHITIDNISHPFLYLYNSGYLRYDNLIAIVSSFYKGRYYYDMCDNKEKVL